MILISKVSKEKLHSVCCKTEETRFGKESKRNITFIQDMYSTNCYTCKNEVEQANLQYHLYFGFVKCEFCYRVVTSCNKFNSSNLGSKEPETCKHTKLNWVFPPVDYLKKLWEEEEEKFDRSLFEYLETLMSLKYIEPFGKAIACCQTYLKEKYFSTIKPEPLEPDKESLIPSDTKIKTEATTHTTPVAAATMIKRKQIPKDGTRKENEHTNKQDRTRKENEHTNKQDRTRKENEHTNKPLPVLPQNGFYLITSDLLNDCPNCYEPLDPKYLKFNISNWLISISCKSCSLHLFFVIDPPDGTEPKLTVINC